MTIHLPKGKDSPKMQPWKKITLDVMVAKARKLGVTGVAGVCFIPQGELLSGHHELEFTIVERFHRPPDRATRGPGDTGANYLAVACSKFAEMLRTLTDSGLSQGPLPKGELRFRGGRIRILAGGLILATFFSGGTPAQDVIVADAGMNEAMQGFLATL